MAAVQQNVRVQGHLQNKVNGRLNLFKSQNWSGQVVTSFPVNLSPLESKDFVHNGSGQDGSKASIIYERFTNSAAWVVAWHLTNNTYKVYVECGPRQNYVNPNWADIELKLRTRGGSSSEFTDFETNTEIAATINNSGALNVTYKLA